MVTPWAVKAQFFHFLSPPPLSIPPSFFPSSLSFSLHFFILYLFLLPSFPPSSPSSLFPTSASVRKGRYIYLGGDDGEMAERFTGEKKQILASPKNFSPGAGKGAWE